MLLTIRLQGSLKTLSRKHTDKVDVPKERQFVGFDGYKKLLDTDIDLVLIATPPGFRPVHFEAAVNAGKHIFAEKPVAVDPAGVRRFLEATRVSKEKDLLVQIGLQRRHEPAYVETIKRLHDGAIGDIVAARAYWNGGGVWTRARKEGQTEMEYQMRNWYYFNWLCGDHITEQHIHNLDVMNWLMDGHPVKGQGQGGRQVRTSKEHGEIYDHHMVEFTYGDTPYGNDTLMISQVSSYSEVLEQGGRVRSRQQRFLPHRRRQNIRQERQRNVGLRSRWSWRTPAGAS